MPRKVLVAARPETQARRREGPFDAPGIGPALQEMARELAGRRPLGSGERSPNPGRPRADPSAVAKAIELRKQGLGWKRIARLTGLGATTVRRAWTDFAVRHPEEAPNGDGTQSRSEDEVRDPRVRNRERGGAVNVAPAGPPRGVIAVGYLRVSTEDQVREGFSLDAQRARIRSYCGAKGYTLLREFVDDGFSGRTTNRPAFQDLMRSVRHGIQDDGRKGRVDAVVVARFDRLNRNLYDFLATQREMQRHKVHFASVDETVDTRGPFGRFFVQVIAAFAELESGIIGERVRHGMRQKALEGGFNGMSAPFGYDVHAGGLAVNDGEAAIVRTICTWKQRGRSYAWIVDALNRDDVPTKKGKKWTKRQLFRIVHNPLYRGSLHWADIVTPGTHPAIVGWSPERSGRRPVRRRAD